MSIKQIVPHVYAIPLGIVNAFLIEADDLTLIDTGVPGSAPKILDAVRSLGRRPDEIRHILVTHCHGDHSGSLAALKAATGAPAYMHPADAALVREGKAARRMWPGPGLLARIVVPLMMRGAAKMRVDPAQIEHEVQDGEDLPIAGSIQAIHVPGHCAGQLAFLWPREGGVLFAADAAANMLGRLGPSIVYEDYAEGLRSLARLAALDFTVACFGHGSAISSGAAGRFRRKWEPATASAAAHR